METNLEPEAIKTSIDTIISMIMPSMDMITTITIMALTKLTVPTITVTVTVILTLMATLTLTKNN